MDPNASSEAASHNVPPTFHREWHRVGASSGLDVWQAGYFKCGAIKQIDKKSPGAVVQGEANAGADARADATPSEDGDVNLLDSEIYSLPDLSPDMLGKQQGSCETTVSGPLSVVPPPTSSTALVSEPPKLLGKRKSWPPSRQMLISRAEALLSNTSIPQMLPINTLNQGLGSGGGRYKAGLGVGGNSLSAGGHSDMHHRIAQQLPSPGTLGYARALSL